MRCIFEYFEKKWKKVVGKKEYPFVVSEFNLYEFTPNLARI